MWTIRCSRLVPLQLFLVDIIIITCTLADSGFLLKDVTLYIKPAYTLERGSTLMLTCVAKVVHSGSDSPHLRFSFFKDYNSHNSIRILETNSSNQVTYNITNARASDSGTYQCDVVAMDKHMESSAEKISINGLQTPELTVDKRFVTQGDVVRITCRAKEESGELSFFINEGVWIIYHSRSTSGEVQKNHSFKSAGTYDLSCLYFINVGSRMMTSNISSVVSVIVKKLEFTPVISVLPSSEVIEGDSVHITCDVEGKQYPSTVLSLSKGSRLLQNRKNPESTLEYTFVVQAVSSGVYLCSAMVNGVEKNVSANLTVKELFSRPMLTITPSEVYERQQFTVTCMSFEFAPDRIGRDDVKYSIYRNNRTLSFSDGMYRTTAQTETNGNYTCMARVNDTIKWSRSVAFTAKVLVSRPSISALSEVVLGRWFQIECYSASGSFPITYTLNRNRQVLSHATVWSSFQKAIFNASILSEKEIREFTCEAQNNGVATAQTSDILLAPVIVPVGKPTLMTLPSEDDITEDQDVDLVCIVTKGSPPISFKFYHGDNPSPLHTFTVMKNHSTYSLLSVKGVHSGRYFCDALNRAGEPEVSHYVMITVRMARWKKGLIAGMCLLGVAGVVLALLIYYKHRVKRGSDSYSPPSVSIAPHA